MSAPRIGLRPYAPADAAALVGIFRASVEELTADDYTEAQRGAWAAAADDEDAFVRRVTNHLALIGTLDGEAAAFASLRDNEHLDYLHVHPAATGRGLATMLYDALEKLARNRGATRMTVESSDVALDFFLHRGFVMKQRNSVHRHGEWLANSSMEKVLSAAAPQPRPR